MRNLITSVMPLVLAVSLAAGQEEAVQLAEPFRAPYTGADATGDHVLALWSFDGDNPLADQSGHGHDLTLNGAVVAPEAGRFGGALESSRGWPDIDDPHQARAANSPLLTPKGPFTIELWMSPKPELEGYPDAFLVDKKYVADSDYQLVLGPAGGTGMRTLTMRLGFGADSANWSSEPMVYAPGEWHHIAFTYDGAGTGRFFVDGRPMGSSTDPSRGSIAPGKHPLVLGDRIGSLYHGFPGYLDQVRLTARVLEFTPASFAITSPRRVFQRGEQGAAVAMTVTNRLREPVAGGTARFNLGGLAPQTVELPTLEPGSRHEVVYPIDTRLRPDTYSLNATLEIPGEQGFRGTERFDITLVPRKPEHWMPVVMWGGGTDFDRLEEYGFSHSIALNADYKAIWDAGEPIPARSAETVAKDYENLDEALRRGLGIVATLSPGRWARDLEEYQRVDEQGKPYSPRHDVDGLFPEIQEFTYNVGASMARTYGGHPAWDSALIHTEVRGETALSYHPQDREAFKAYAGYDIPEGLDAARGTDYGKLEGFPADRVIADDYAPYVFYRWFWKVGDGWNTLHTKLHQGLKSAGNEDVWTFHDPAVRVPSVWGNGGESDILSQWTYSYPDPIRIGMATDELFAMARGNDQGQDVMKMTQIIWYRSQTAPEPGEEAQRQTADFIDQDVRPQGTGTVDASGRYVAEWERRIPDARFITISPMHLREAFWAKTARPIKGIMYHGWGSLVDEGGHGSYRYTHPETKYELKRLVETVVEPLGPMLVQVPDRQTDIGFVESFASQMFARRGTWGWNGGWAGDAYLILHYAQLQPQILYEETLLGDGLDAMKVLFMMDCDVLPRSVADRILAWQQAGGLIVGDENLCPAIKPDIVLASHQRPKNAKEARELMLQRAAELREQLDPHYTRYAQSANPDVITRVRSYGSSDYLFAVNDNREFGDYVGHHELVMENGLPSDTVLTLARGGSVYDLLDQREVTPEAADGALRLPVSLGPGEGRLYLVTDRPIAGLSVSAPERAAPGDPLPLNVLVTDPDGQPINAVVPLRVDILDPDGRPSERSGWYGAAGGTVRIDADIAPNDKPGLWRIQVRDLASGREVSEYVRVGG